MIGLYNLKYRTQKMKSKVNQVISALRKISWTHNNKTTQTTDYIAFNITLMNLST